MKKVMSFLGLIVFTTVLFSSCTTYNTTMKGANTHVELTKSDFTLSEQVNAEAKSTTIIGIDFKRLFSKKTGNIEGSSTISLASIPVVGNFLADQTANYALHSLMTGNPGYDVVFYPQYETKVIKPILGLGFLTKITTVKTKARLGKLNK